MLVAIHSVATAEAARVIIALGIPHDVAERVLTSGWAASAMLARNLGASLRDEPLDEGAEIRHLALALQVLHPIIGRNDVDAVLEPVVLQRFEDAMRQGLGTTDISGMVRALDPNRPPAVTLPGAEHLSAAVEDSAAWCDIVCSTHGLTPAWGRRVWSVPRRSPLGYPDATTLVRGVTAAEVLERIDSGPGASVKDSYADLDLAPHGFEVLFDASWIARSADHPQPGPSLGDIGWESVDDEPTLRAMGGGARDGRRVPGDAAGSRGRPHPRPPRQRRVRRRRSRVGTSATSSVCPMCSARADDPAGAYAEAAAAALACYPGRPLVGYESGDDLVRALAAGFRAIGPLRVWVKS